MRYETLEKVKCIFSEEDKDRIIRSLYNEIEIIKREIKEVEEKAKKRLEDVDDFLKNNKFRILGRTCKNGKEKEILLILRFCDGTQIDYRYKFLKIADMRNKLQELKEKYSDVSWEDFEEEIK